jgi:hypothetical protein
LLTAELPGLGADFLGVVAEPTVFFLTLAIVEIEIDCYDQPNTKYNVLRGRTMESLKYDTTVSVGWKC